MRALARKGRHGRKQPFDIMHKAIMWWEVGGVVTRAGSTFIDEDEVITKAGSTYTGSGQTTTTAGSVVLKPRWSTR